MQTQAMYLYWSGSAHVRLAAREQGPAHVKPRLVYLAEKSLGAQEASKGLRDTALSQVNSSVR